VVVGAGCSLVALNGVRGYLAHAPAWHASAELAHHPWPWLANAAPLALLVGAWLALGTELWLAAPINRPPAPSVRGLALALTLYPAWAGLSTLYARLRDRRPELRFKIGRAGLRPVVLAQRDLMEHTVIFGASGSGKTNTLRLIAAQAISGGWPVVVLDLKGDPSFADELAAAAAQNDHPFQLLTIADHPDRAGWNPLRAGDSNSRADRLILGPWEVHFYKRTARNFARACLRLTDLAGINATLPTLLPYLSEPRLLLEKVDASLAQQRAAGQLDPLLKAERQAFAAFLARHHKDRFFESATSSLVDSLSELVESSLKPALANEREGRTIDLERQLSGAASMTCFSLDSAAYPTVSALAGSLVLQELQHGISSRPPEAPPALLLVDEFSVLESDEIRNLLARARSKRVGVVLSTQSLADLTAVDLNLKTQTLSNTATKIIHRLGGDAEAEVIAELAGTRSVQELTHQTTRRPGLTGPRHTPTGAGSAREVEQYALHPNRLRSLKRGHAAIILRAEPQWHGFARIDSADKECQGRGAGRTRLMGR
jgi:conjugal transfer pilus assembly protein TraD